MSNTDTVQLSSSQHSPLEPCDTFARRHLGPSEQDLREMLSAIGVDSLEALADEVVPEAIHLRKPLNLPPARSESQALNDLRVIAAKNKVARSFIGQGYYGTITPPVIQRNILENPGWYTQYTPYQAEISQGRLEALLNYQTMVADLTGLPLANASLLDEATAAAEAMTMAMRIAPGNRTHFLVAADCHPQTIRVIQTRAEPIGVTVHVKRVEDFDFKAAEYFGVLLQYPTTDGRIEDYTAVADAAHAAGAQVIAATDLLALTLIKPPGEWGADIAVGNSQRFGVPMGFGGPHAAFMATHEQHARKMPGRIVGVSKDSHGQPAYRLAIQTREQHIKRDRATSNICTAQVLLAIMAGMYAVYHGPEGLRKIAMRVHRLAATLAFTLQNLGHRIDSVQRFDTIRVRVGNGSTGQAVWGNAKEHGYNLRLFDDGTIGISLDETATLEDVNAIASFFAGDPNKPIDLWEYVSPHDLPERTSDFLAHAVFHSYHAEHEMLRYIKRLEAKDLSLTTSMIPLGSCTMKLNATAEMLPVSWPEFAHLHPYAPADQTQGYAELFRQLEQWLAEITGFAATSLQPNAGSQGEYAGLLAIRAYHKSRGDVKRTICLIPVSAHGTNPASAVMAGMKVVPVECDRYGNISYHDLEAKAKEHADELAALMITYPSTHGVFEPNVRDVIRCVHEHGGLVYMDGANMNAQVGLCSPGDIGADVCHLNLHKTFCIPHGGGGPGMGPICVNEKLAPFLPCCPVTGSCAVGAISAAPYGSPSILPIPWTYIAMMGAAGLKRATQVAILSANYMAHRLKDSYPIMFTGLTGRVAHEFILDCRDLPKRAGISVEDIAKRLMDYGFHAPTMSFPVAGTLMIEPTESESKAELDRLCDALIAIRKEIDAIESGRANKEDNVLHHAPHTAAAVCSDDWPHTYSRTEAAYPAHWLRRHKYWPPVGRIDNPYGDRNLVCACPTMEEY